jgi:hypothetical protein
MMADAGVIGALGKKIKSKIAASIGRLLIYFLVANAPHLGSVKEEGGK